MLLLLWWNERGIIFGILWEYLYCRFSLKSYELMCDYSTRPRYLILYTNRLNILYTQPVSTTKTLYHSYTSARKAKQVNSCACIPRTKYLHIPAPSLKQRARRDINNNARARTLSLARSRVCIFFSLPPRFSRFAVLFTLFALSLSAAPLSFNLICAMGGPPMRLIRAKRDRKGIRRCCCRESA